MSRPVAVTPFLTRLRNTVEEGCSLHEAIQRTSVHRFLVFATEWTSGYGGLSTFNRKLCLALVEAGHDVCVCLSTGPAPDTSAGILFVRQPERLTDLPRDLDGFRPDFILGHDRHTGSQALGARAAFRGARTVVFIHTDPKIEFEKGLDSGAQARRREEKERAQRELVRGASVVAAVGPRLREHAAGIIDGLPIGERPLLLEFVPGFEPRNELGLSLRRDGRAVVLFLGRTEDGSLKGLDLFIRAMRRVAQRAAAETGLRVVPEIVGAEPEKARALFKEVWGTEGDVRIFTEDEVHVQERIRASHLVLMPSREEGFGLVAMEALEANRPVLASKRSGFAAWLLGDEVSQAMAKAGARENVGLANFLVEVSHDEERDDPVDPWVIAIERALADYANMTGDLERLRCALSPHDWTARAVDFISLLTQEAGEVFQK